GVRPERAKRLNTEGHEVVVQSELLPAGPVRETNDVHDGTATAEFLAESMFRPSDGRFLSEVRIEHDDDRTAFPRHPAVEVSDRQRLAVQFRLPRPDAGQRDADQSVLARLQRFQLTFGHMERAARISQRPWIEDRRDVQAISLPARTAIPLAVGARIVDADAGVGVAVRDDEAGAGAAVPEDILHLSLAA